MAYRSNIDHHLTGSVDFTVNSSLQSVLNTLGSNLFTDTGVSAGIDVPESVSLSLSHQINPKWKVMADATWTKWERYDQLVVVFDNPSQADSIASKHYQNSWRYSLGASYMPDQRHVYRMGIAYDESAVRNATERTAGSPGNDRLWLALGYGYKFSDTFQFDAGYAHLFIDDTPIDNEHALWGSVTGSYEQSVDILGAQFTWRM
jgi:long-chain fatty acid transport protein